MAIAALSRSLQLHAEIASVGAAETMHPTPARVPAPSAPTTHLIDRVVPAYGMTSRDDIGRSRAGEVFTRIHAFLADIEARAMAGDLHRATPMTNARKRGGKAAEPAQTSTPEERQLEALAAELADADRQLRPDGVAMPPLEQWQLDACYADLERAAELLHLGLDQRTFADLEAVRHAWAEHYDASKGPAREARIQELMKERKLSRRDAEAELEASHWEAPYPEAQAIAEAAKAEAAKADADRADAARAETAQASASRRDADDDSAAKLQAAKDAAHDAGARKRNQAQQAADAARQQVDASQPQDATQQLPQDDTMPPGEMVPGAPAMNQPSATSPSPITQPDAPSVGDGAATPTMPSDEMPSDEMRPMDATPLMEPLASPQSMPPMQPAPADQSSPTAPGDDARAPGDTVTPPMPTDEIGPGVDQHDAGAPMAEPAPSDGQAAPASPSTATPVEPTPGPSPDLPTL